MKGSGTHTGRQTDVNHRRDEILKALVSASAMSDEEVDALMSRMSYRRMWANIIAERERRAASAAWLDLTAVGYRVVPALLTIAIALTAWRWMGNTGSIESTRNAQDAQLERVAFGGATMVSDDDVLTLVMHWPLPDSTRQEEHR